MRTSITAFLTVGLLTVAGCGDSTGPSDGEARLDLGFRTGLSGWITGQGREIPGIFASTYNGSNGTLELDETWLIISDFQLKRDGETQDCDNGGDCEDVTSPPALVELPMDSTVVSQVTVDIPEGMYSELELSVEDLELDEADEDQAEIAAVFAAARAEHPDWPSEASLLFVGTFTPSGGSPVPFRTFVEAEIEVQLTMDPPLDATGVQTLNVIIVPSAWVELGDGSIFDLSAWDYATTGQLLELEIEVGESFAGVEIDG